MSEDTCILLIAFISKLASSDDQETRIRLRNKAIWLVEKMRRDNETRDSFMDEALKNAARIAVRNIELNKELLELKKYIQLKGD